MVMRVRGTGATFGVRCSKKGPDDKWAVKRCVEQIAEWGLTNVRLMIRSDGDNAIKAFRQAMCSTRVGSTLVGTSPPRDPQSNGVAERAVKELTGQLRRVKIGLEARVQEAIPNDHPLVDWMCQHSGFLISKFLQGSRDGFTAHYRMHKREYKGEL